MKKLLLLLCTFLCSVGIWADTYQKITSVDGLESGCDYLIVYEASSTAGKAMTTTATTTSTKRLTPADVTINNGSITTTATNIVWKLSGSTNNWMFYNGSNYVNGTASGGANCTGTASTGNKYTITTNATTSGTFDLTITDNADRVLEYNTSGPYFAHYKSTQASVCLYKKVVSEKYTVTFNAGTNGTCSTSSLTEASAGAGVTLPSCTPNSGYGFLGWTATEGKTTIDNGLTTGATYKPSANTTLYAVYGALYQVTIEDPTNGTLAVTCGGNDVTSGEYYAVGQDINIVATPSTGYKFRNIQVVDNSTHTFTASNEKVWTMGASDITIKANFDEIVYRTITWSIDGNTSTIAPTQVEDGINITFPSGLADINGKKFMGWSANSAASAAGDLVSGNVAASVDATYYAVFATITPGTEETANLTISDATTVSYTNGLTRTDDQGNDWISYACISVQSSNGNNYYMLQINKNSNGYYVGSPDFGNNVKAISAKAWNTSNSTRYAYLRSNTETKQPSTSDYGTTEIAGNSKGVEIDFTINNDAEFSQFYIYSSGSIGFEWIEVTYGTPDIYSEYTTTPTPSFNATISTSGLTTVCLPYDAELNDAAKTAGAQAWKMTNISNEGVITLEQVDALKANEGFILQGEPNSTVTLVKCDAPVYTDNLLNGVTERTARTSLDLWGEDGFAFPWILNKENNFVKYTGDYLPANKAYLDGGWIDAAGLSLNAASLRLNFEGMEDGYQTAISLTPSLSEGEGACYDLFGRKSNGKGLMIQNGKVILVK